MDEDSIEPGQRNVWAQERTLLVTEWTFGSWLRTGFAGLGVALGVRALFDAVEPAWLARALATGISVLAVGLVLAGLVRTRRMRGRFDDVPDAFESRRSFLIFTIAFSALAAGLVVLLWML